MFEKTLIEYIHNKIHLLKVKDLLSFLFLIPAIPYALFLRLFKGEFWLVREIEDQARDNGYAFFIKNYENNKNILLYYAIEKCSKDYQKLEKYGNRIISFGSLRHWAYYLACSACVSSVKRSGPTALSGLVFRNIGLMNNKMFFLGHGITKDNADWLHYCNTKFRLFCCGAFPEYKYVKEVYGYPEDGVAYTGGLCRYDLLHEESADNKNVILIMPTWRMWLAPGDPRMKKIEHTDRFEETNYFRNWNDLINSKELADLLEKTNTRVVFFPHPSLQSYVHLFRTSCDRIFIADQKQCDLQPLIKCAKLLVTDYSSVYFDFIYQKKPVVYYQFDSDVYRANHYSEGWYQYHNNPFGKVVMDASGVINEIKKYIMNEFFVDAAFLEAHKKYFPQYDSNSSQRTFNEIYSRLHPTGR